MLKSALLIRFLSFIKNFISISSKFYRTHRRLYLLNDNVKSTKIVADQINCYMQNKKKCDIKLVLIYVPRLVSLASDSFEYYC